MAATAPPAPQQHPNQWTISVKSRKAASAALLLGARHGNAWPEANPVKLLTSDGDNAQAGAGMSPRLIHIFTQRSAFRCTHKTP